MKCPNCKILMIPDGKSFQCPKCSEVWTAMPEGNYNTDFDDYEYFCRHQDKSLERAGDYAYFDNDDD